MAKIQSVTRQGVGRVLMTLVALVYGVIPPIVDLLTDTHVFHPDWLPHARFHTVWLLGITTALGVMAAGLVWWQGTVLYHLSGGISACILCAFMLSVLTAPLYGGALSDLDGAALSVVGVDANVLVFALDLLVLMVGWRLVAVGDAAG